ncbi:MAG TPA: hypothetical protein VEU62_19835 [Bryobacterales bacterium]|nr:hypothetical protein [Bryobacterales bacterium]
MLRLLLPLLLAASALHGESVLLVLHKSFSSLGFYSLDGRHQLDVPVGEHPHEMVISPDRRFVYISNNGTMRIEQPGEGGNTISVVDLALHQEVARISLGRFRRPHGLSLDAKSGALAVTAELPEQELILIDTRRRAVVQTYPTRGQTSHMVTWGPGARWAFVSNSGSANVSAIDVISGKVQLIPAGQRPEGSVLSRDGRFLYVCNRESASLTIIDTAKRENAGSIATARGPVRIALTPDGRELVYACMHDKKVEFADPAARRVLAAVPLPNSPVSISLSPDGQRAYASAEEQDTVYVISVPDHRLLRQFQTSPSAAPDPVLELASP